MERPVRQWKLGKVKLSQWPKDRHGNTLFSIAVFRTTTKEWANISSLNLGDLVLLQVAAKCAIDENLASAPEVVTVSEKKSNKTDDFPVDNELPF